MKDEAESERTSLLQSRYLFGLFMGAFWMRIINQTKIFKTIGPLITIIQHMMWDLGRIIIIFILVSFLFTFIGIHILDNVSLFGTLDQSLLTLFSWGLGQFSLEEIQGQNALGVLFMVSYLLVSFVLLLNLLIAMFSSTYARFESLGDGLYFRYLLALQPKWQFHPSLNFLTLRNPFLSLLSLPLLLCPSCGVRRLSRAIEVLHFLPVYVSALALFLSVNVVTTPFSWLKQLSLKRTVRSFCSILFLFPFFSLFFLLPKHFFIYAIKLWDSTPRCLQEYQEKQESFYDSFLTQEDLNILLQILDSYNSLQDNYSRTVSLTRVVREFRERSGFTCNIQDFKRTVRESLVSSSKVSRKQTSLSDRSGVQTSSSNLNLLISQLPFSSYLFQENELSSQLFSVSRFNNVKKFLAQNSLSNDSQHQYIYPRVLSQVIRESREMARVRQAFKENRNKPHPNQRVDSINERERGSQGAPKYKEQPRVDPQLLLTTSGAFAAVQQSLLSNK